MPRPYFSCLLRLWRTDDPENPCWRVSLEDPHTRQMRGFNSLEAFWQYLLEMTAADPGGKPHTPPAPMEKDS